MNSYQYDISLRVRHPSLDPAEITSALGLNPSRSWRAGEVRTTPKGNPLEARYSNSYWVVQLGKGGWPDKTLAAVVNELLDQLAPHQGLFQRIRAEGGTVEFFVGWLFEGNSGDVFDCDLLARMADLKIDLSLDVYPPDPSNASG
jgi:Domain of unknown function (DUF4279)